MNARPFRVDLDWTAYYRRFREEHGEPVLFRGRATFPDGWQYSATDARGPEYEPPKDPTALRALLVGYWSVRRSIVKKARDELRDLADSLEASQRRLSVPLQQRVTVLDDETGRMVTRRFDVSPGEIRSGRLADLEHDLAECDRRLEQLNTTE